jgi:hypothetical protein
VALQQLRHREDRADAHLVRLAAGDGEAAEGAERLQAARSASFASITRQAEAPSESWLALPAVMQPVSVEPALQGGQALAALVSGRLPSSRARDFGSSHLRSVPLSTFSITVGDGTISCVEAAGLLGGGRAALALQREFVLRLAADAVAPATFSAVSIIDMKSSGLCFGEPFVAQPALFMLGCTRLMDLDAAADHHRGAVDDDALAAMAIACRPDEQKRLTVMPEVVTGRPARMRRCGRC